MELSISKEFLNAYKKRILLIAGIASLTAVISTFFVLKNNTSIPIIIASLSITTIILFTILFLTFRSSNKTYQSMTYSVLEEKIIKNSNLGTDDILFNEIKKVLIYKDKKQNIIRIQIQSHTKMSIFGLNNMKILLTEIESKIDGEKIIYNTSSKIKNFLITGIYIVGFIGIIFLINLYGSDTGRVIADKIIPIGGGLYLLFIRPLSSTYSYKKKKYELILGFVLILFSLSSILTELNDLKITKNISIDIGNYIASIDFPSKTKITEKSDDNVYQTIYESRKGKIDYYLMAFEYKKEITRSQESMYTYLIESFKESQNWEILNSSISDTSSTVAFIPESKKYIKMNMVFENPILIMYGCQYSNENEIQNKDVNVFYDSFSFKWLKI